MGGWGGLIAEPTEEHTDPGPDVAEWKVEAGEGAVVCALGGGEKGEAKGLALTPIGGEVAFGGSELALLLELDISNSRNGAVPELGVACGLPAELLFGLLVKLIRSCWFGDTGPIGLQGETEQGFQLVVGSVNATLDIEHVSLKGRSIIANQSFYTRFIKATKLSTLLKKSIKIMAFDIWKSFVYSLNDLHRPWWEKLS